MALTPITGGKKLTVKPKSFGKTHTGVLMAPDDAPYNEPTPKQHKLPHFWWNVYTLAVFASGAAFAAVLILIVETVHFDQVIREVQQTQIAEKIFNKTTPN